MPRPKGHKAKLTSKWKRQLEREKLKAALAEDLVFSATESEDKPMSVWWNAMPGSEYEERCNEMRKQVSDRADWLLKKKKKPSQDAKYQHLRQNYANAQSKLFAGYEKIDWTAAERLRAAHTRREQRFDWLLEQGQNPRADAQIATEDEVVEHEKSLLDYVWINAGEALGFERPNLKRPVALMKNVADTAVAKKARMGKAHHLHEEHLIAKEAEALARANSRGAIAPLQPSPRDLVRAVREVLSEADRLAQSPVFESARFIHSGDCRTWPTLKDCVMAFAASNVALRRVIATMPDTAAKRITPNRPRRYSPAIVVHLIDWWLAQNRKTPSSDTYTIEIFERISILLKP